MAKVFGIHTVELHPGVDEAEFEQFVLDEVVPSVNIPGWKLQLLKGERGERAGKYVLMLEVENLDARNRYYPAQDQPTEEAQREAAALEQMWDRWKAYATTTPGVDTVHTDYVLVAVG